MHITWLAHAAFLIEGEGVRIITDPYKPAALGFAAINAPADIVIRSSADDEGHCYAEMITGSPVVVTATELDASGVTVRNVLITAIAAQESLIHKVAPGDNALYRFTLEGIRIAHLGDVGNALTTEQLAALAGVDLLLVPTGGPPTIGLDDLYEAIEIVQPRVIIPMHYHIDGASFSMLPVSAFTDRFPSSSVVYHASATLALMAQTLPSERQIIVLRPSTAFDQGAPLA